MTFISPEWLRDVELPFAIVSFGVNISLIVMTRFFGLNNLTTVIFIDDSRFKQSGVYSKVFRTPLLL